MKRRITLLLALALLLTLTACRETPEAAAGADRAFNHYVNGQARNTQDVVYFLHGNLICYTDKTTGVSGPLCGKPECGHNDQTCNAYAGGIVYAMDIYQGRLYWLAWSYGGGYEIFSAEPDGTARRTVRGVKDDRIGGHTGGWEAVFCDGYMFLSVMTYEIRDGAEAASYCVFAFPLDAEEEPILIVKQDLDALAAGGVPGGSPLMTIQAYDGSLYMISNHAARLSDPSNLDLPAFFDLEISRWDLDTREFTTLYHEAETDLHYIVECWVTDDGVMFWGEDQSENHRNVYRFDFASGEIEALFPADPAFPAFADGLVGAALYRDGILKVVLRDFEGKILLEDEYPLEGGFQTLTLFSADEDNAYLIGASHLTNGGAVYATRYTIAAVALDGGGIQVMSAELPR